MKGSAGIAQIMATIEAEQAEQQTPSTTKTAKNNHGSRSDNFNKLFDNFDTGGLFLPCSIDSISTALKTSHLH